MVATSWKKGISDYNIAQITYRNSFWPKFHIVFGTGNTKNGKNVARFHKFCEELKQLNKTFEFHTFQYNSQVDYIQNFKVKFFL